MTMRRPSRLFAATCSILAALAAALPAAAAQARATTTAAPPAAATLDRAAYATALSICADRISALRRKPAEIGPFRKSLPAEWRVRAGGRDFRVSTAWLDGALADIEKNPAQGPEEWRAIGDRLRFLREQALAEGGGAAASPAVGRARLEAIFKRSEFRGLAGPSELQRWWWRVSAWIGARLAWLIARLHLGGRTGNTVAYGLIFGAVVLLSLALWRSLADRARQMELEIAPPAPALDWRTPIREALEAAERGEFREAIHAAYWGAVGRLEDSGIFPRDRSRTPRELRRLLDSRPEQRAPFGDLAARFELVWYGNRSASPADWEMTRSQLERMGCLGA